MRWEITHLIPLATLLLLASHFIVPTCSIIGGWWSVKIVDKDRGAASNIESIATLVCSATGKSDQQIGRVSTINRLNEFLRDLPDKHPLTECKRVHGEAVRELHELTSVSNKNVCSDEKVSLIEKYHDKYISTNEKHRQERLKENTHEAPVMLRLFFMHYAMEVSAICKQYLINNLEWDLKENLGHVKEFQVSGDQVYDKFGGLFNVALKKFTEMYDVKDFDDVVLFWPLIDGSIMREQEAEAEAAAAKMSATGTEEQSGQPEVEVDPETGEQIRLRAMVKRLGPMREIQWDCLNKYKPIYSKLIMPIIRLANLGYSNTGEQFRVELEELKNNQMVKNWYSFTQFCEVVVPIKFYEVAGLEDNQFVFITKEEASRLEGDDDDDADADDDREAAQTTGKFEPLEYEPTTNSFEEMDLLMSVETDEAQALVSRVEINLTAKNRSMRRAMVHMFRNAKKYMGDKLNGLKVMLSRPKLSLPSLSSSSSSSPKVEFEKKDVSSFLESTVDKVSEQDLAKIEGGVRKPKVKGIQRQKGRQRKGDVDMVKEMRTAQLSYMRTKTWTEIWDGWMGVLSELAPSRFQIIAVSMFVIFLMIVLICVLPLMAA